MWEGIEETNGSNYVGDSALNLHKVSPDNEEAGSVRERRISAGKEV